MLDNTVWQVQPAELGSTFTTACLHPKSSQQPKQNTHSKGNVVRKFNAVLRRLPQIAKRSDKAGKVVSLPGLSEDQIPRSQHAQLVCPCTACDGTRLVPV